MVKFTQIWLNDMLQFYHGSAMIFDREKAGHFLRIIWCVEFGSVQMLFV